ncbi:MAG: MucB/RseB C-terminal domain-containing protein [Betaproteobacteria bacterium]|nr:MucB/RseB C-terminal domain-containing protein [Betaproteobacteria bacterium]
MKHLLAALLLGLGGVQVAVAQTAQPPDAVEWLQKIANAARQLNYSGTFIYQYGNRVETSRIIHMVDASGEHEKLETLDGSPREVIRNNDEVKCFLPDTKTVKVEKRTRAKSFPALLPQQLSALTENYAVRKMEPERIAGYDCQVIILEPRDGMRYGHKLWADAGSGLLLKATMLDEKGQVVEQFAFTELRIGGPIDREALKPKFAGAAAEWREDRSGAPAPVSADTGWSVKSIPPGFRKVTELKRSTAGRTVPVSHIVYSDGLAAVSVFIEPLPAGGRLRQGLSNQGAINVYTRSVSDHTVTVLGETPAATVMQIGNSVSFRGK